MSTCCIGSQYFQLVPQKASASHDADPTPMPRSHRDDAQAIISTTASALESAIISHLEVDFTINVEEEEEEFEFDEPIQIYDSYDAHVLRCRPLISTDEEGHADTIFGIAESAASLGRTSSQRSMVADGDIPVRVSVLEPSCEHINIKCNGSGTSHEHEQKQTKGCCCQHPRNNWIRQNESENCVNGSKSNTKSSEDHKISQSSPYHANVKIVDLTKIQDIRRTDADTYTDTGEQYPRFDTPGKVFHLLRSVLNGKGGLHCASPWDTHDSGDEVCAADQVVALLVHTPNEKQSNYDIDYDPSSRLKLWEDFEQREFSELLDFRVGDAAPSYFLHSTARVSWGDHTSLMSVLQQEEKTDGSGGCSSPSSKDHMLFVYRRLLPRDILSRHHPLGHEEKHVVGCLWETFLEEADEDEEAESDSGSAIPPAQPQPTMKQRMVSPPYQSHAQEYPGLLDSLLKGIDTIREEAQRIPQWTAWPEQNHYADNSWNVFPLCYTFPANDITQRKYIQKTCSFVPETTKLLQTLGPALRTALFSRLDPRAKLGAHTGWSDLANHVLRVHIPLIVPGGKCASSTNNNNSKQTDEDDTFNTGLCGTWVDGCVETHEEGRVISFDDSKIHRAFNYSEEERIVLIVDLLRPKELPMGTATGGHSDELDAFISSIN